MNLFQWVSLAVLLVLAGFGLREFSRTRAPFTALRLIVWTFAAIVILFPDITSKFASVLGIGRGTDLVIYLFILLVTFVLFHLYGRSYVMRRDLVELARREAIRTASQGSGDDPRRRAFNGPNQVIEE